MMAVERTKKQNPMAFQDLSVGQIYEGENGSIRLKTSYSYAKGNNCLVWKADVEEWVPDVEMAVSSVIPLKSKLTILE